MLVLTVSKGGKVFLTGGIEVQLLEAQPNGRCRLGFTAPRDVTILREALVKPEPREDAPSDVMAGGMHHFPGV